MNQQYHDLLRPALIDWRRRVLRDRCWTAALYGSIALGAVLLIATVADSLLEFGPLACWGVGGWGGGGGAGSVGPPGWRPPRPGEVVEIAEEVEIRLGLARESLVTAVWQNERPAPGVSGEMVDRLVGSAVSALPGLDHRPRWRRAAVWASGSAVLVAAAVATVPQGWVSFVRVSVPWAEVASSRSPMLMVTPTGLDIRQGETVRIVATLDVARLPEVRLRPVLETTRDGLTWTQTEMSPRGSAGFVVALEEMSRGLRYRVRAGSLLSPEYSIRVMTPPAVTRLIVEARYPRSLGGEVATLSPTRDESSGLPQVRVPMGSLLTLRLSVTEGLDRLTAYAPGLVVTGEASRDAPAEYTVQLPAEVASARAALSEIRLELDARTGQVAWTTLLIATIPDADPAVSILSPLTGTPLGPRDDVEVLVSATDDTGLARAEVRVVTPRGPTTFPVALDGNPRRVHRRSRVSLAPLGLVPGEPVSLSATVEDVAGRLAVSAEVELEISATAPDPLTSARVAALSEAASLAETARAALKSASERLGALQALSEDQRRSELPAARLAVAAASDAIARAQRSLARLVRVSADPVSADAVARLADGTIEPAQIAEESLAASIISDPATLRQLAGSLAAQSDVIDRELSKPLRDLRRGETSALLIGSREAARSMVAVDDGDLIFADDARLEEVSRTALTRLQSLTPPDLARAADRSSALAPRFDLAWRIEALRPDSIAARASDLALASRAAARLPGAASPPAELLAAVAEIEAGHLAARYGRAAPPPEVAGAARRVLRSLAGETEQTPAPLAQLLRTPQSDDPDARRAARLTDLNASLRSVVESLRRLARPVEPRAAAAMESSVRDLIRRLDALEGLPEASVLQPRIEAFRAASAAENRLEDLDTAVRQLSTLVEARQRLSAQSPRNEEELASVVAAIGSLREALAKSWADAIRDELRRFVPELAPAAFAADRSLKPALTGLSVVFDNGADPQPAIRTAIDALYRVQREVDAARTAMTRRDPVAAARANLAAAASSLRRREPDLDAAQRFMASAERAVAAAADQSSRARTIRLLMGVAELSAFAAPEVSPPGTPRTSPTPAAPGTPLPAPDLLPVPEPYRDAVEAYFQAMSARPSEGGAP